LEPQGGALKVGAFAKLLEEELRKSKLLREELWSLV